MSKTLSREIRLVPHPQGLPVPEDFKLVQTEVPEPGKGQVLVRNFFTSVDPYMRGRMNADSRFMPPFRLGEVLDGRAVGQVVVSNHSDLKVGDAVTSTFGWREYFVTDRTQLTKVDPGTASLSAHLGVLGITGLTAWGGVELGALKPGETLFVSAAAGAVGHLVGQLAKIRGCRVSGSAGTDEKVRLLIDELGFDGAFNYKTGDLISKLSSLAPNGLDAYFDNVGGAQLEAALSILHPYGRVITCGSISGYNSPSPNAPNKSSAESKHIAFLQLLSSEWRKRMGEFLTEMNALLAEGRVKPWETVVEGLENAPQAFIGLFRGDNIGKMVVKLRYPEA